DVGSSIPTGSGRHGDLHPWLTTAAPAGLNTNSDLASSDVVEGFATPSRKQELYSQTLVDWRWPEYALPGYIKSHVDPATLSTEAGEFCLLPTFRLPVLIHTRSGAAKWLNEIAQCNPIWLHPIDGKRLGIVDGDLARVTTEIGYFVDRVWLTEAIR